jgi:hypothetical protein
MYKYKYDKNGAVVSRIEHHQKEIAKKGDVERREKWSEEKREQSKKKFLKYKKLYICIHRESLVEVKVRKIKSYHKLGVGGLL